MKQKYEYEIEEAKEREIALKLRLETVEKELHENVVRNKEAIQKLEMQINITKQMELEKSIKDCKGLPYLLIKVAEEMNKNTPLWQICVSKKGGDDYLKGTHGHSKAKRKEMIVYKKKDKDSSRIGFESEGNNNTP